MQISSLNGLRLCRLALLKLSGWKAFLCNIHMHNIISNEKVDNLEKREKKHVRVEWHANWLVVVNCCFLVNNLTLDLVYLIYQVLKIPQLLVPYFSLDYAAKHM